MPKIKLQKLDKYEFKYSTTLQVRDINYGGHLGNDALIGLVHEARLDLLRKVGASELNLGDGKTGIIMSDLAVNYLGEGFLFDEIDIFSHLDEFSSVSFRMFHLIHRNEKAIGLVEAGIITFNYHERQIADVPTLFLDALNNYISHHK